MNTIDDAIHEGLLERRIYCVESGKFYINLVHPIPKHIDCKFAEQWFVIQATTMYYGKNHLFADRDVWGMIFEPHRELEKFYVTDFCENILQNEIQKKMTE